MKSRMGVAAKRIQNERRDRGGGGGGVGVELVQMN